MLVKSSPLRSSLIATLLVVIILALLYLLSPILMPFLISAILAYLCNPLVVKLMRLHLSRTLAVSIVFVVLFIVLGLFILIVTPMIQRQISEFITSIPHFIELLQAKISPWLMTHFKIDNLDQNTVKKFLTDNAVKAGETSSWAVQTILTSGKRLLEALVNLVLIPVVTFYLLRDWEKLMLKIDSLVPRKIEPRFVKLIKECDTVLSAFFRGQLLVMLSLCIFYSIGLSIMGLQIGILIGVIIGVISIVPYLGVIIGGLISVLAALAQFGTLSSVFWVLLIFGIGHLIENLFLTPKLIGDRTGLHPVTVIFAVLVGAKLFGFFGVLLALPVASIAMVLLRSLHKHYHASSLYQE